MSNSAPHRVWWAAEAALSVSSGRLLGAMPVRPTASYAG
ncbi:hypothetical protein STRIP9103_01187 [Streptomyces ipomoeae 91-03]|uniref:Uncharacterized protein n=1 Tax=Streptomyces ipomoeae 91-03 TaxID=698759 RepID=L1KIF9_9ACTN|nr:hypothetical protein STRIP9103_01187 [Streptomyces ipomoeae 91-03]